ncbi:hypothetical protein P170DRAFT_508847 [Aspergillus steynii IBT 23096]|uniref:Myb-like DNA-binding domain protein n=1 Tax=Aspergillus steynii IBT 23096 TaxID=1392250 RepID=A0A2I2GCU4_9EURO|nr:uncharacterized protein P170DRAFT_508847 [Aspergillus steynii IBT 23096]PLB50703.1 hypothetical protein P170DRAFT_508847 [Aspergillus steynii IBT 23096]
MEPPSKRPRLSLAAQDEDDTSDVDLQEARFENDQRLKSIFEGIFQKYEKDFTEVGDEIDLQTGKIVINNGHLQGMDDEHDTGEKGEEDEEEGERSWLFGPGADWSAGESESHGQDGEGNTVNRTTDYVETRDGDDGWGDKGITSSRQQQGSPILQPGREGAREEQETSNEAANADLDADDDTSSVDSLLDTALDVQNNLRESLAKRTRIGAEKSHAEKANSAAETSVQSKREPGHNLPEPAESLWRVPEIDANFSTPTWHRSRPKPANQVARSESPPQAGSIWALPGSSRRRPVSAKKRSPKKQETGQRSRKIASSPVVFDWSFAETPDGNESDDPLQEEVQPSPTPKDNLKIRGKMPTLGGGTKTELQKGPPDDRHGPISARRELDAITNDKTARRQPNAPKNVDTPCVQSDSTKVSSTRNAATAQDSTPTNKQVRMAMTPDEARTIVITRHVEGKMWKEVLELFPQRTLRQIMQWNQMHWNDRRANPPPQSGPWTDSERKTLERLKDQRGLTWPTIRAALPGRSQAELEFELLHLWVGDDVWNNQQKKIPA